MKNDIKWKVSVSCMTYNQSQYISDAMNGFTMQKTNFPFVCTIVDDASTDGEQKVIKDYLENNFDLSDVSVFYSQETDYAQILFAQHKENKNCYFAVLFLKENHYSIGKSKIPYLKPWRDGVEYLALCEGDDWWSDVSKLQKQYDVLESHTELDMCACGTICYKNKKEIYKVIPSIEARILSVEEIIIGGGGYLGTNTLFFRKKILSDNYQFSCYFPLDYFIQIHGALKGGIFFIPDCMSAYRVAAHGSWSIRMNANPKSLLDWKLKSIRTLNMLDEETLFKYHDCIINKINQDIYLYFETLVRTDVLGTFIKNKSLRSKLLILYYLLKQMF